MAGWISQGESFFKVTLSEIGQQTTRNEFVERILIEIKSSSLSTQLLLLPFIFIIITPLEFV